MNIQDCLTCFYAVYCCINGFLQSQNKYLSKRNSYKLLELRPLVLPSLSSKCLISSCRKYLITSSQILFTCIFNKRYFKEKKNWTIEFNFDHGINGRTIIDGSQRIILANTQVDRFGSPWNKAFKRTLSKPNGLPEHGESLMPKWYPLKPENHFRAVLCPMTFFP